MMNLEHDATHTTHTLHSTLPKTQVNEVQTERIRQLVNPREQSSGELARRKNARAAKKLRTEGEA